MPRLLLQQFVKNDGQMMDTFCIESTTNYTIMEIISVGKSDLGAHVQSNFDYLIFLRQMFRSGSVTNLIF